MKKIFNISYKSLIIVFIAGVLLSGFISFMIISITYHKAEAEYAQVGLIKPLTENDIAPEKWGENFPYEYASYLLMEKNLPATDFSGGEPYSKLIRNPSLTSLWAGYPFSVDYNTKRSHIYSQIDQMETKRNNKAWLNAHGFPAFKGQPGACMNCHSGYTPSLIQSMGWEAFNKTPYIEIKEKLIKQHGEGIHKGALGGTCSDCHSPNNMKLRVTRPAFVNAMVQRGYEADSVTGIKGTPQEFRSYVCQQCHVEYYFKKDTFELTYPWKAWPKNKVFNIEMLDTYYASVRNEFPQDWKHKITGASMLKIQHPEAELNSSGIHARSGVACADCHMPYTREGARKVTSHNIRSPLFNINGSCQTCHNIPEQQIKDRVKVIQMQTASSLRQTEGALLALIQDVQQAKTLLQNSTSFTQGKSKEKIETDINNILHDTQEFQRRASLRWDFIFSENSTGFHSPTEAQRVLAQSREMARQGQLALANKLAEIGIKKEMTVNSGTIPTAPEPISDRPSPVGDPPSKDVLLIDEQVKNLYAP